MRQQHSDKQPRSLTYLRLILGSLAVVALQACGGSEEEGGSRPSGAQRGAWGDRSGGGATASIPVKTEAVERAEMTSYIETHARLEAERWVDVVSRTQGLVERLAVEEGDEVQAGDVLVQLDKSELKLQMEQARVTLEGAQARHDRAEALHERQLVSQEEFEDAIHQLQNAEVNLKAARLQLEYADVRASIAGVVMVRNVEQGDLVRSNEVVFSVADLEPLQARIRVPEKRMTQLRKGQEARVTVDPVPDRVFPAQVRMISPGVDPTSGTVKVTLDIPSNGMLRPGMFATIRIVTDRRPNALVIPKKALVLETDEEDVYVVREGKAERVQVDLGYVDGDRVEVRGGLRPGDQVVTVGHEGLKEGASVRVVGADTSHEAPASVDAGGREQRALPDSATFIARAKERGLSDEDAAARYTAMKKRMAEGGGSSRGGR
ncbi:MAG: efflux RND transporter periplasmic adaptor subunit [Gemmatimonadetes bacterium]|jgi:membrane fusion protein, multidrug efflux system|nr:efflux RND transporter periplasmic adaptor subunit [Gemmatimonadota bacterium]MBT7863785.1 efflux RND transporter periplasmic adaptor subunit [Gemmatimonadota bacterium]